MSIFENSWDRKSFHRQGGGKVFREEREWVAAPVMKPLEPYSGQSAEGKVGGGLTERKTSGDRAWR